MPWKTIAIYYLGATLTFVTYFAVAWWTGWVLDETGRLQKSKLIVHAFVFLIAFALATVLIVRDAEREARPKYTGILDPATEVLVPSDNPKITRLELGWTLDENGTPLEYYGGPLSRVLGAKGTPWFEIFDDISLSIGEKDEQVRVSFTIRDETGSVLARLIENEWQVAPPPKTLDRNYSKNILEVINDKGEVFLQVRVLEDRIQLNGVFYNSNGYGVEIIPSGDGYTRMHILGPDTFRSNKIEPIFKYPSERHLGELR